MINEIRLGNLIIVSSPSGGGKDAVINALLKIFSKSSRLITTTSRSKRPGNKEGVDYYFISQDDFKNKINNGDFIEYNIYSSNYYGTQKKHLEEKLMNNKIVLSQLEVNGKHNLDKLHVPHLSIYLLPENLDILQKRIQRRGGLTTEQIKERMRIAELEIKESEDYDFRIVNKEGRIQETIDKIAEIIQNKLLRPHEGVDNKA
jgi:guanylate kinase